MAIGAGGEGHGHASLKLAAHPGGPHDLVLEASLREEVVGNRTKLSRMD